jgi:cytochrome c oxidase cbb3-type subunit I/II
MPAYPWLIENNLDISLTPDKIKAMRKLGVPYPEGYENQAVEDLKKQAKEIAEDLKKNNINTSPDKEIIALIAYLQRLGVDVSLEKKTTTNN